MTSGLWIPRSGPEGFPESFYPPLSQRENSTSRLEGLLGSTNIYNEISVFQLFWNVSNDEKSTLLGNNSCHFFKTLSIFITFFMFGNLIFVLSKFHTWFLTCSQSVICNQWSPSSIWGPQWHIRGLATVTGLSLLYLRLDNTTANIISYGLGCHPWAHIGLQDTKISWDSSSFLGIR